MNTNESYFNTTKLRGDLLQKYVDRASDQDTVIMEFFMRYPESEFTPCYLWSEGILRLSPITSVRRSINTLTKAGILEKLDHKVTGIYGRPVHVWRLLRGS